MFTGALLVKIQEFLVVEPIPLKNIVKFDPFPRKG